MTVHQDLPRFAAFEEWVLQPSPEKKPKAPKKKLMMSVAVVNAPSVVAVEVEWKLLRRFMDAIISACGWVGNAVWNFLADCLWELRQHLVKLVVGGAITGGVALAHFEFNAFDLKHEAPKAVVPAPTQPAANDNLNHWTTQVHPEPKRAARK